MDYTTFFSIILSVEKYLLKVGVLKNINENEYILTQEVKMVGKEISAK